MLVFLFILGGAIVGAWVGDGFGAAVAGAAIGWLGVTKPG